MQTTDPLNKNYPDICFIFDAICCYWFNQWWILYSCLFLFEFDVASRLFFPSFLVHVESTERDAFFFRFTQKNAHTPLKKHTTTRTDWKKSNFNEMNRIRAGELLCVSFSFFFYFYVFKFFFSLRETIVSVNRFFCSLSFLILFRF